MEFFENLTNLMASRNVSAYKLEKDTGIKQTTFQGWKRGSQPTADKLLILISYFEVSFEYLVGIDKNKFELSSEEKKLLENYRKASAKERAVVNMILAQEEAAGTDQDENHEPDAEP